jgi:hypothetical protein
MLIQYKRRLSRLIVCLGLLLWQTPLKAESSVDALCEKLYSELLSKAKQALVEGKRDDAIRFLLQATTVTERCATSTEPQQQQGQEESLLSSVPLLAPKLSESVPLESRQSL